METPTSTPTPAAKSNFGTPMAIVIAGGLIALAVYFSGGQQASAPAADGKLDLVKIAKEVGVKDRKAFAACVSDKKYTDKIEADMADAASAGGQGTPYSILLTPDGRKLPVNGAVPYGQLKLEVQKALAPAEFSATPTPVPLAPGVTPLPTPVIGDIRPIDDKEHVRGNANAEITLLEYSDLSCPYCKQFHPEVQQLLKEYPQEIKWVFRHLPLTQIHPHALEEAHAAECAGEQGKFWEYVDAVYEAKP